MFIQSLKKGKSITMYKFSYRNLHLSNTIKYGFSNIVSVLHNVRDAILCKFPTKQKSKS